MDVTKQGHVKTYKAAPGFYNNDGHPTITRKQITPGCYNNDGHITTTNKQMDTH